MIGFAGKYRLFPCNTELYMVCERRNPAYPGPSPPIIKKIPTRRVDTDPNNGNSFVGSNNSPSFGIGGSTILNQAPAFAIGANTQSNVGKIPSGNTLPRPVAPRPLIPVSAGSYNPVVSIALDIPPPKRKKNPFIQLHDKIADEVRRKRILKRLAGLRYY